MKKTQTINKKGAVKFQIFENDTYTALKIITPKKTTFHRFDHNEPDDTERYKLIAVIHEKIELMRRNLYNYEIEMIDIFKLRIIAHDLTKISEDLENVEMPF